MKIAQKRWGEVTIKKQGDKKNKFDKTLSFSVEQTETNYTLDEYTQILKMVTNLTRNVSFDELYKKLNDNIGEN
jgi:hypothetical protein